VDRRYGEIRSYTEFPIAEIPEWLFGSECGLHLSQGPISDVAALCESNVIPEHPFLNIYFPSKPRDLFCMVYDFTIHVRGQEDTSASVTD
jgi:hypothetical protein